MRALVTGAAGFVGGYLTEHLLQKGDEVLGTYIPVPNLSQASISNRPCDFVECDVTDAQSILSVVKSFKPDVVYHLAAIAFVPDAEANFVKTLTINVAGTSNVVKACALLEETIKFILISSADVYGMAKILPVDEDTNPAPRNNYSLSKIMSELVLDRYIREGRVQGVIMRPFNHIGAGQNESFVVSSFAKQLAMIAKGEAEPVIRVGDLTAKRDFSDVRDIVRAYRLAAEKGSGVYNLCSGQAVSIQEILDTLIQISGVKVSVEQDPARMRRSDTPVMYGTYAKAEKELGWHPTYSLQDSLESVYTYWINSKTK